MGEIDKLMYCYRDMAKQHGDDNYVQIACTCGHCAGAEAAWDWMEYVALTHDHSDQVQRDWFNVLRREGYALPQGIWQYVEEWIQDCIQQEAKDAERAAGWDPNP